MCEDQADVQEVGRVLSVGDGIARIYGLKGVKAGETCSREPRVQGFAGPSLFVVSANLAGLPGSSKYTDVNGLDKTHIDIIYRRHQVGTVAMLLECCRLEKWLNFLAA